MKYRPQSFLEVAGQQSVIKTLKNSLESGKIGHAYLFSGSRGTGKTSMARLFAKALNCEEGTGHQCGHCQNCLSIADGTHPDIIEIDAASNNGVEQVRDLIDKIKYSPIRGRYKVYIIDEVHMMSAGAFNALLKTLEEPPENVIFILCTTEPHKVLPTILSRCQRFDFSKIQPDDMKRKLLEIIESEHADYELEALDGIVSLAEGGMRDALSILDQLLAFGGNSLTNSNLLSVYGLASLDEQVDLIKAVINGNATRVIGKCELYGDTGIDIRRLLAELVVILKDVLVYGRTKAPELLEKLPCETAKELSSLITPKKADLMLRELMGAQADFKHVSDIRSLFELALLRLTEERPGKTEPVAPASTPKKAEPVSSLETERVATPLPVKEEKAERKEAPPTFLFEEEQNTPAKEPEIDVSSISSLQIALEGDRHSLSEAELISVITLANKNEKKALIDKWIRMLEPLKADEKVGMAATLLSDGNPFALSDTALILAYNHTRLSERANIKANQKPLEDLVEKVLGRRVFIYALSANERAAITQKYYQMMTSKELPKRDAIVLNLPIEK